MGKIRRTFSLNLGCCLVVRVEVGLHERFETMLWTNELNNKCVFVIGEYSIKYRVKCKI